MSGGVSFKLRHDLRVLKGFAAPSLFEGVCVSPPLGPSSPFSFPIFVLDDRSFV